jgi:hypothetical protein
MALLFYDGFEGLAAGQASAAASGPLRYVNVQANAAITIKNTDTPGPNGYYLENAASSPATCATARVSNHTSGVMGVRFRPGRGGGFSAESASSVFRVREDGSALEHLTVRCLNTGALEVRRGNTAGTVLGTTATLVLEASAWRYVEMKYIIDDTNGGVWLRVDGIDVLRLGAYATSPTTLDTRNGGTGVVDGMQLGGPFSFTATQAYGYDDIYILDLSGSAPYNDFLGAVSVRELTPNAAGASAQFTPLSGTNWESVDELPGHDGDTSYVESGTAGHRDLYNLTTATVSNVLAVKTVAVARRTDAGPTTLELSVRSGSTTGDSAGKTLAGTYGEHSETFLINPATSASFVPGDLADLQAGVKVPG